ncbi:MAG: hypothetical protein JO257_15695 [Deltaproteobacteria bacterium]|nr:hypothetical protein [Deltaproteobacteria bacterium]
MADPIVPSVSTRVPAAFPPRWAFFKGLLTGAVIEVPALAAGVWMLGRLGVGNRHAPFMHLLRLTAVFAGVAAVLTAAGVGRLAAHASIDKIGGRRHAVVVAARAHAVAGVGLLLIAAIPHGHLPNRGPLWLWIPVVGAAIGAACGSAIGVVCGGAAPGKITDVMALAIKRPTDALKSLLDPEDLLKLGAAVRQRTTQVFGGMFEPAERPPEDKGEKRKE